MASRQPMDNPPRLRCDGGMLNAPDNYTNAFIVSKNACIGSPECTMLEENQIWVSGLISRLQDIPKRRDQGKFFGQVEV